MAIEALVQLKKHFPHVDIIGGNVATAEVCPQLCQPEANCALAHSSFPILSQHMFFSAQGTRDLIDAGADGVKVGVGPGSMYV